MTAIVLARGSSTGFWESMREHLRAGDVVGLGHGLDGRDIVHGWSATIWVAKGTVSLHDDARTLAISVCQVGCSGDVMLMMMVVGVCWLWRGGLLCLSTACREQLGASMDTLDGGVVAVANT